MLFMLVQTLLRTVRRILIGYTKYSAQRKGTVLAHLQHNFMHSGGICGISPPTYCTHQSRLCIAATHCLLTHRTVHCPRLSPHTARRLSLFACYCIGDLHFVPYNRVLTGSVKDYLVKYAKCKVVVCGDESTNDTATTSSSTATDTTTATSAATTAEPRL